MAKRTAKLWMALGIVAAGSIGGRAVRAEKVETRPIDDWLVLPSLMDGNGEIIVGTGALFLPWRRVRGEYDYDDAGRLEGGIGLGGVPASAGVARLFDCPHAMSWCTCPYSAPEVYRAAWLTNWTHRRYVGLDLGANLTLLKVTIGALHAAEDRSSLNSQLRIGFGW